MKKGSAPFALFPSWFASRILYAALALLACVSAQAASILETAPPGLTNGGTTLNESSLLGARFTLASPFHITAIGGEVKSDISWDRSLFIALVPLTGPDLLPADDKLSNAVFLHHVSRTI